MACRSIRRFDAQAEHSTFGYFGHVTEILAAHAFLLGADLILSQQVTRHLA
jgi:hypothetical protein